MRDLDGARAIVQAVADRLLYVDGIGQALVNRDEFEGALTDAVEDVADLLDPDEVFDVEVEV